MMRKFYPELFHGQPEEGAACAVGSRIFELSEFLKHYDLLGKLRGSYEKRVAFHNSCHSARELELRTEFRALFEGIEGLELVDPSPEPVCCGFGGLFCQKFQGISEGMAVTRLEMCRDAQVDEIVSNDPGCIMHMRLIADQQGFDLPIRHSIEVLVDAMRIT
jgi:L-lactate dehydrogenase complex protein LldE